MPPGLTISQALQTDEGMKVSGTVPEQGACIFSKSQCGIQPDSACTPTYDHTMHRYEVSELCLFCLLVQLESMRTHRYESRVDERN